MKLFFSVGEPSGDLHGANLIEAIRERTSQQVEAVGYGGPRMQAAGAELHYDLTSLAVMGFLPVVGKLPKFLSLASQAEQFFKEQKPDAVVLIDFPGFNWHIARLAKRHGVPVFYYGTPQVWGWASWRVKRLQKYVDHALCKLPFEERWLRERGVNATYVGHPYFDELHERRLDEEFVAEQRDAKGPLVTLLPGSRTQEVRANFPSQLRAAERIRRNVPSARFIVAAFKESHARWIRQRIADEGLIKTEGPEVHVGRTPELIEAASCCVAVSGSVSLELLHHAKPSVIVYKISRLMYGIQGWFRRVRYITLVNLLTASDLFPEKVGVYDPTDPQDAHVLLPEYLTWRDPAGRIATHVTRWLTDPASHAERVQQLQELRLRVDTPGASQRTADYLLRELGVAAEKVTAAA